MYSAVFPGGTGRAAKHRGPRGRSQTLDGRHFHLDFKDKIESFGEKKEFLSPNAIGRM